MKPNAFFEKKSLQKKATITLLFVMGFSVSFLGGKIFLDVKDMAALNFCGKLFGAKMAKARTEQAEPPPTEETVKAVTQIDPEKIKPEVAPEEPSKVASAATTKTATVEPMVQATEKTASEKSTEKSSESIAEGDYTIQIASVANLKDASKLVNKFTREGLKAFYLVSDVPGKGRHFRINIGTFGDALTAMTFQKNLRVKKMIPAEGFVKKMNASSLPTLKAE